ncbi:MAG: hypothetical protein AAF442_00065 [Pseudomonadota bacterium]
MGIFSRPDPPDTSAADAARARAESETAEIKKQNEARVRNVKNRRRGRALLAFKDTGEQGVKPKKKKLGG